MLSKLNHKVTVNLPKVVVSKTEKHIDIKYLLLFVLAFAVVGTYVHIRGFADTPVVASLEAETMSLPTGAQIITDSSASGAKSVKLSQNGSLTASVSLPSQVNSFKITARGDQCSGSPAMAVSIDGTSALPITAVSSTSYAQYSASYSASAGSHVFKITSSNTGSITKGKSKNSCNRFLYLDVIRFYGPDTTTATPPTISLSATPTAVATGGAPSLSWSSTDATSCTASGGWNGSKTLSGTETQPAISTDTTYSLSCTGPGGSASTSATVTIAATNTSAVPASIASDCSVDVTQSLLTWIASVPDNYTLAFGAGKCYRIDGTVELRGRSGLVFEGNGATFKSVAPMTSGNATDDQRAMFRVIGSTSFVFHNMIITGAYTKGGTLDDSLQHAHGFDIRGTSAEIANTTVSNIAGDCAYFGLGYDNVTRSSGSYLDSTCTSIGRNGMAVTAGNNINVQRNTVSNVGFDAFDVEPNVGSYTSSTGWGSSNITIDSNTIKGYYHLYAYSIVTNAPNSNQYFTNNKVIGNGLRIGIVNPAGAGIRAQNVNITGNTADTATWSPALEIHLVDILNVTNNTIPMSGGTMATVDSSCKVNISGNTYVGGSSQVSNTNPTTGC
jgi:hypothetical protein